MSIPVAQAVDRFTAVMIIYTKATLLQLRALVNVRGGHTAVDIRTAEELVADTEALVDEFEALLAP